MPDWRDDELEALRKLGTRDRAGMAAFRERYPHHSRAAVTSKLAVLRIRGAAADVERPRDRDPFPAYRYLLTQ